MHLYFEEDGAFKAGTVLSQAGTAYQVELTTGRRTKVKQANVFFSFESPSASELMTRAPLEAAELDPAFLWEVAPESGEFGFADLAAEYWGGDEGPVQKAALLLALHGNPVYFYRKGRGVYRRAPADILQKALEAVEKKKRLEAQKTAWAKAMAAGELPEEIGRDALKLLTKPDKNGIAWKALSDAASETRQTPLRLLLSLGAIPSAWDWHVESFYALNFPQGRGFPAELPLPGMFGEDLPVAEVDAFSIDDSATTEIDDAVSVTHLEDGRTRVGVHIAAPSLGILRDDPLDKTARSRMSTVYAPGLKTTMLPEPWVKAFSLDEGTAVPCVSIYFTVKDETFEVESSETKLEKIVVAKNLRYDKIDDLVTEEALAADALEIPYAHEVAWLWHFAKALQKKREEVRGRPEPTGRIDWYFVLEGEGRDARVVVKGRRRGAPLDLLVAELMILANSTWGLWLEEKRTPGIYRSQRMGRVRMSTSPAPHDGLGVARYAWSTSPLRRYVDLVNQRQIVSALLGTRPVYQGNDADFFTIVSQFEAIYGLYNDFQTRMERYWSLRWIEQEGVKELEGAVIKGELVRIDGLPFVHRVAGLPEDLARGRKVRLQVIRCDLVDLVMETKLLAVLDEAETSTEDFDEEVLDEEAEAAESAEAAKGEACAEASAPEGDASADANVAPVSSTVS